MASADVEAQTTKSPSNSVPDFLTDPNAVLNDVLASWRHGAPPDYSRTRKYYEQTKTRNHAAGSLAQLVENLVKNWEIEASFKTQLSDYRTIDRLNYTFAMNGSNPRLAEHMLEVGTYNAIISPNEFYSPETNDFDASHKTFKRMMPTFAWEVLEVYSAPPQVVFRWRHWGVMKNDYTGFNNKGEKVTIKAHNGLIEVFGFTTALVDGSYQIQRLDTYFDPSDMFRQIALGGVVEKPVAVTATGREDSRTDRCPYLLDATSLPDALEKARSNGTQTPTER